jgi:5-methylcytosine-specific restriction endonuclease McrA
LPYKDQERREKLAAAQGGDCTYCKKPFPEDLTDTAVDHIIPRCRGGPDAPWNFCLLHRICNYAKGRGLTPEARTLAGRYGVMLREPLKPWRTGRLTP